MTSSKSILPASQHNLAHHKIFKPIPGVQTDSYVELHTPNTHELPSAVVLLRAFSSLTSCWPKSMRDTESNGMAYTILGF